MMLLLSLLLQFTSVLSSPLTSRDLVVKHAWDVVPDGWHPHSVPSPIDTIKLQIGLKQHGIDQLITSLYEVSDPYHPRYGQHLSKSEVENLVAPHPNSVSMVEEWLVAHDIDIFGAVERSPAGDWLSVSVPISKVEQMLATKYHTYRHGQSSELVTRALSYSLPRILHDHIDVVVPTTMFGSLDMMRATHFVHPAGEIPVLTEAEAASVPDVKGPNGQNIPASCNTTVTPTCLQALYRTAGYVPTAAKKGNAIGINGFLEQFLNFVDLQTFFSKFRPDALGANVTVISVDGGLNDQTMPGVEAALDNQYTEGLTFPTPNVYYTTPGTAPTINDSVTPPQRDEPYMTWLNFILAQKDIPHAFTTSYGGDEQTFPKDFAVRVCNQFAQLGARGGSVMFSSGDGGVGAGTCQTNDGTNRTIFQPVFPATCPFVTAVGATFQIAPEKGIFFSQGGFSVYFPRPSFQDAAVPPFLRQLGNTYKGLFNPAGRGVPDVSAQGEGFQVVVSGEVVSVGGTSASSPTFASIVTLLNDFLISRGRPPLGFLNPFLYSKGLSGLVDILLGNNPGCGTPGFNATKGWDAVTGLGTPDFIKLTSLLE
ncbi:subtilisin-like protein [Sistotremastrum suecicum HHB10207 ss-3]|uniref:tripeptidyl-peptidase II n=1 Tax=Sistotremastrum suecicum HHB10207 ss-3 TaxID=1314776 RepID=A0A166IZ50_9AGAM|nr:subtilisin-like protein [Sistotremastrum suecicum HHB10207 ss-3]